MADIRTKLKPLLIGNVKIDFPVILAPMAGYTDAATRLISQQCKAGLCFTEVANAEALLHNSIPTFHILETFDNKTPVAAHIYGSNPEIIAKAAIIIEQLNRFSIIDINCGCPVRKIMTKNAGATLMSNPELVRKIVKAATNASSLPITIKTRIGIEPGIETVSEIAQAAEEGGASAISVHARYISQKHGGKADWSILRQIKSERSIPVIGNGGVSSVSDITEMILSTGVDGIMIGRAAIGNPWIFKEYYCMQHGLKYHKPTIQDRKDMINKHLNALLKLKEIEYSHKKKKLPIETATVLHFRAHLFKYLSGFKGWNAVKQELPTINSIDKLNKTVDKVLSQL